MVQQKNLCLALIAFAVLGLLAVFFVSRNETKTETALENFIATRQPTHPIPEQGLPENYDIDRKSIPPEDQASLHGEPTATPQACDPKYVNTPKNQENLIYTRGLNNTGDFTP